MKINKKLSNNKAINIVIVFVAITTFSYIVISFFLLSKQLNKSNIKSNILINKNLETKKICIENKLCLITEIADTFEKRKIGLMNREQIDEKYGMLFIFQNEGLNNFRMKNTLIKLDILRIDKYKKIIGINKNTPPCKIKNCPIYKIGNKSLYVLEIKGGTSQKYGIKTGDKVLFK